MSDDTKTEPTEDHIHIKELGLFMSANTGELFTALSKAQGSFEQLTKGRTAEVKSTKGTFKYSYSNIADTIEAVRGSLAANGLCIIQPPVAFDPGSVTVSTVIGHSSGQWLATGLTGSTEAGRLQGLQALGSGITYLRRYAAQGALFLAADDDDGQSTLGNGKKSAGSHSERYTAPRVPPPAPAAKPDEHHLSWTEGHGNKRFFAALKEIGLKYDDVRDWCVGAGWNKPSTWTEGDRGALANDLKQGVGNKVYDQFSAWYAEKGKADG